MATAFTLSFGGSTVDDEEETCELYFSSNVPTVGVTGVTFNYKPTSTSKTITSITIPASGIDLANVFVPFLYENYNTFYGSLTIKRRTRPTTLILPYIPFNVSAPQGRPTITQLSINPPDISGIYNTTNLLGQPSSTNPDYSNLWLNCNNYNADLVGNLIGDIYALQFYMQSTDPSANLNDGVGIYTYYNKDAKTFSGASYSSNTKTIYIPNNVTSQISASNQYVTGDNIQDIIKTTAVSYDSGNNRTVITVSSALSTSSSNDNIIIASFLTGNNANIGITSVIDSSTGSTIPLVEDVYYSIYIEVSRFSSIDAVVSDIIDYSFFTNKINVPTITAVSNNGTDDTLQFTFNPPSDASSNGLHNVDSYILTYGASDSSANFVDTSNANVLAIVQMTSGVASYTTWSMQNGVSTTNTYVISNSTSDVWFQNIAVFKKRNFPIGTVFGLTGSGLKKNNQVREYGFTGTYALTSEINMVVNPTLLAVTVGKIANNETAPLSKTDFDNTGTFTGTYIPVTVTGRIGTYGFNDARLTKSPVSIFLNDIQLDCFDLSSNDYDASGAYPTNQLVTFKVKAFVNYVMDYTSLTYGQGFKISSKLTDITPNNSSTAYLMTTSTNGVYNSSATNSSNGYSYKIQDFPEDISGGIALDNFYFATRPNPIDFNYVKLVWSITNTNSKNGLTTGSIQRITYNGGNNGTNIQDVSSSLLSTIFATNATGVVSATLQTYTVDLNKTVTKNDNIFTTSSASSNEITFPGIGPITNLMFVQNPSYTMSPTIRFQFGPPNITGIDNTKFNIEITYGFSNTKVTFNPVSITPVSNIYTVVTQSTNSSAELYVPFTLGDNISVKVTPTDIYGQPGNSTTINLQGLEGISNLQAAINNPFTEYPQVTVTFENGNGAYYIFFDNSFNNTYDKILTNNIVSTVVNGSTKIILQSQNPTGSNYINFTWGDDLTVNVFTKDASYNYLGKIASCPVLGIESVSNLTFIDNSTVDLANPYVSVSFKPPADLPSGSIYYITATNITTSTLCKFTNAPYTTSGDGYGSLSLVGPDGSGNYQFITQSTSQSSDNYFAFTWGHSIRIGVQPVNANNELGVNTNITLTGTVAVTSFAASINDSLTDIPTVTLSFNNNGSSNAFYYATVTDEAYTTLVSNVVKSSVSGNITKIKLSNSSTNSFDNYVSTFNWGDPLTINLYQKNSSYENYFSAVATTLIGSKNMVSDLTFAPNDSINNASPYITVNFKRSDNFITDYYYISITNTTNTDVYKFSNAPTDNQYNNLTLTGPDANGLYKFVSQSTNNAGNNYLPFTFGDGFDVTVQAVEGSTNILSTPNTITLNALEAVTGLKFGINNLLTETPQLTLNFTNGNSSYFVSAYNRTTDSTKFYTNPFNSASNGLTTIILENDPTLNFNDLSFNWGDDFEIKVYNKYPIYNYLGAVSQVSLIETRLVSELQFINNADYNNANPYATVQFTQPNNAPTPYYFITAQKINILGATIYKYCNAPEYNTFSGLTLTGPDASGIVIFETQSSESTDDNYFPFTLGDGFTITVRPVDASTNELGDLNSVTFTGTTAVTSFQVGINNTLTDSPEVTFVFNNNGATGGSYYAEITDESSTVVIENVVKYNVTNDSTIFIVSQEENASYNYVPNFNWGDPLTINIYQRDATLSRYLGSVATTSITGKNMVTGLTFAPNDSINNESEYITVNFKRPNNLATDSYFITITNAATSNVYKYSNAPYFSNYDNLTLTGPDASGVYTFISQSTNTSGDNYLPFAFGQGIQVIVQGVEELTNILSAPNTITLNALAAVTGLKFGINNLLTETPQLTLNFTNGNGSYFVSTYNRTTDSTRFYTNPISSVSNGLTKIILENDPDLNFNDLSFNWGDDFDIKVYNKYITYDYLGTVSQVSLIEERLVSGLQFINNATYNTANPYATVQFTQPNNAPTPYYFITAQKTNVVGAPIYKYCNAPEYNNYGGLTLTEPGASGTFVFETQSSESTDDNYFPFTLGDGFTITVRPVDASTNELGDLNSVTFTRTAAVTSLMVTRNAEPFNSDMASFKFNNNGATNAYYYAEITDENTATVVIETLKIYSIEQNIVTFIVTSGESDTRPNLNSLINIHPEFFQGEALNINIYQKDGNLNKYLGAVSTISTSHKNMVSGLTFVSNDSINESHPYISVNFKAPDNFVSNSFYVVLERVLTGARSAYSNNADINRYNFPENEPEWDGTLTLIGPDASGVYAFITQSSDETADNYFPYAYGDAVSCGVFAIEDDIVRFNDLNTITLNALAAVNNLKFGINNLLTETPQLTITFTNGNSSYFVSVHNRTTASTEFYNNPISSASNGLTTIILENDPTLNFNDLSFNWGDDFDIRVYNKHPTYDYYFSTVSQVSLIETRLVSGLQFINNATYNTANPYATVQFTQPNNAPTPYYFITAQKNNVADSPIYKYCNAPEYNTFNGLTLTGPDDSGSFVFETQSLESTDDNYFLFTLGDGFTITVRPVDASTNELGDLNSVSFFEIPAVTSFTAGINVALSDKPEVTFKFNNGGNFNEYYYAEITDESSTIVIEEVLMYIKEGDMQSTGVLNQSVFVISKIENAEYNYVPNFNWGDPLTIKLYLKNSNIYNESETTVLNKYLGPAAIATIAGKNMVSGLTFAPNDSINNTSPYITVNFKRPDNVATDSYFITITNTTTNVYKYSNAPYYSDYTNLTLSGPDASGVYTFITQSLDDAADNYLPFTFGQGLEVIVQAVEESTNILSATNTITLPGLSAVSNLSISKNSPLTDYPQITLSFNGGNGSYFVQVYNAENGEEPITYTNLISSTSNGLTKIILESDPSLNYNDISFNWGTNLTFLVYNKYLDYHYLGTVSEISAFGSQSVNNLFLINNVDIDIENPYFTASFGMPNNINTDYYFINVFLYNNDGSPSYSFIFSNATNDNNYGTLVLDNDGSGVFTFRSQSSDSAAANYVPFAFGTNVILKVSPVDNNTNILGRDNNAYYNAISPAVTLTNIPNFYPTSNPRVTVLFTKDDYTNYDYYLKVTNNTNGGEVTIIPQLINAYDYNKQGCVFVLENDQGTIDNFCNFNWGDDLNVKLYKKDPSLINYFGGFKELNISNGGGVRNLTISPNPEISRYNPYIILNFTKPEDAITTSYLIKIVSNTLNSEFNYSNTVEYSGVNNLDIKGLNENGNYVLISDLYNGNINYVFTSQQDDEFANNYLPFNWGDDLTISITYVNENLGLSQTVNASIAEISEVRQLAIVSNADMYYDSNKQFHPYITFSFLTPLTGSPPGNSYFAIATVNESTTPQTFTFNGNSAVTQSIDQYSYNYLDFEYGDKIDLLIYPLSGSSNRLGKISSTVTVKPLTSVRNLQFISNSDINNVSPYISLKFRPPVDISGEYYNITVNNNNTNQFNMFRNLPGFGNDPNERGPLTLVGPDVSGYYTFISQSSNSSANNYLNFTWGDSLTVYVAGLDSNGDPGAFDETGITIPEYYPPTCGWLQNDDISLNPYVTVLLDISGVDANALSTVNSYYMNFIVNDVTITNMIANISTGSITTGSIIDNSIYVQAIPGTTTQYNFKTQSTNTNKSNYLSFNWNDKVVLTVYPITTGTNRLGRKSDNSTTRHNNSLPMTVNPIQNADYQISEPYITLNATYYSKYYVSIVDNSNNMWNFVYESAGNTNQEGTVTTIITTNSIVPITTKMRYLNVSVFNLDDTTYQLYNKQTITYDGISPVTPSILQNSTVNPTYGYLTIQFSVPTFGTISATAPYVIAVTEINSQTRAIYQSTVYDNSQIIPELSNDGLSVFKESAVIRTANRSFTTQSYDNTKPNYLPFTWGNNYTITVYAVNQYNYLGAVSTLSITGMPALTLALVDTHKTLTPTVKVKVTGTTNYSNLRSNIYVNENSTNSVGPLFLTNPSFDSSGVITIPTGASCINYPTRSINSFGQTSDISGSITSASFVRGDEVTIDVRVKNDFNHLSATTIRPISIPYYLTTISKAATTTVGSNKVLTRDITFNGQAIEQLSFSDIFRDINEDIITLQWLLSFTLSTNYEHKYNTSDPNSENVSLSIETIGVKETNDETNEIITTYTDATSPDYQSVLDSLCITSISLTTVPYTTNNRALISARLIVTYNAANSLSNIFITSVVSPTMSGQNNFGST